MTPREAQLSQQLEQCQEALAAAQREITLLRQKLDALATSNAMPKFHVRDSFEIPDRKVFVLAGSIVVGEIWTGMFVRLPLRSEIGEIVVGQSPRI